MSLARTRWRTLSWLWRRLGRMSPLELPHRAMEQIKRLIDRWHRRSWSAFGCFGGGVLGLSVSCITDVGAADVAETAASVKAGRFIFLGRAWPLAFAHDARSWWNTGVWLIDPVSKTPWPGSERAADQVDYRSDPRRGDVKFVWELNRLQFLPSLALQARREADAASAALVFQILRGWMHANPPGRGVNWTSGIEAATRVASLLAALAFVDPQTAVDEETVRAFLEGHVWWIARYPSRFSSANNHRVAEAAALFLAYLSAPGLPGAIDGARRAKADLEREMLRQFHDDGVGAEQSNFYTAYSLEWFALAGMVGDGLGRPFSAAYRARARRALDHLRWIMDEAGRSPRVGDSDDGCVLDLGRKIGRSYGETVAEMTALWLGASAPKTGAKTFRTGGQTVWRRPHADGALLLAFDHGPLGHFSLAAHGHADALSVWLHWGEEAVFADPGTYLYHAEDGLRDALRGTMAHNTLAIAEQDQSRIVAPFAWSRHARTRLLKATDVEVEAEHDGYRRRFGLIHRRRVRWEGDELLIEDFLLGQPKITPAPWSLGFTLSPQTRVEIDGRCVRIRTLGGRRLTIIGEPIGGPAPAWRLKQVPFAPAFGQLQSAPRLERSGRLEASALVSRIRIVLEPARHQ